MRIVIRMTPDEYSDRDTILVKDHDNYDQADKSFHLMAENIHAALLTRDNPDGVSIDLEDSAGRYLYTIVGEPR